MRKLLLIALAAAANCPAQVTVRQYLSLTDTQVVAIQKLNGEYNQPWFAQQDRIDAINRELAAILDAGAPDPLEIGKRAVETELIRRDRVARQIVLQQQVGALLTPTQERAVENLISANREQPLVNDAACAYLVNSNYAPNFISGLLAFRVFEFSPLPYIPPAPAATFCGSVIFPASVREYLGLTDLQVAAIASASAAYNNYYALQQIRLRELEFEIADLEAPGTDAVVLGLRYAEMAGIGKEIAQHDTQLRDAARQQLTAVQAAKLKLLQDVQGLADANVFHIADGCNLVPVPNGASLYGTEPGGNVSFCSL